MQDGRGRWKLVNVAERYLACQNVGGHLHCERGAMEFVLIQKGIVFIAIPLLFSTQLSACMDTMEMVRHGCLLVGLFCTQLVSPRCDSYIIELETLGLYIHSSVPPGSNTVFFCMDTNNFSRAIN